MCVCVFVYLFDRCRSRAHVTYEIIGNAACGKPAKESFRRNTVQGAGISVHVSLVSFLPCVCVCTDQTDAHAFHVHSVSVCMLVRTFIRIFTPTRVQAIVPMQQTHTQGACVHSDGGRFVPAGTQQTRSEEVATGRCRLTTALTPRSSRLHYVSTDSTCHRYIIRAINGSCLIRHHT